MRPTRSTSLAVNTLSSYVRFGVSFVVWFFLTPMIVATVGTDDFGLWALLTAVFGFGSLLDFGLGTSLVRFVGDAKGAADTDRRNRVASTVGAIYLAVAVVAAAVIFLGLPSLTNALGVPSARRTMVSLLVGLFACRLELVTLPLGIFRGVLFGEQRICAINIVQAAAAIVHGLLAWAALKGGSGLVGLGVVGLGTVILEHLAYVWLAYRGIENLRVSWRLVDRRLLGRIGAFSVHSFAVAISAVVLLRTDPVLVKLFLPLSAVAVYAVAMKIAEQAHLLLKQFVNALSPLIAELESQGDTVRLRLILIRGTKFAVAPAVLALVGLGVFGRQAITFWLDPTFSLAWPVLMVLMTAVVVSMPELVAANVLTMSGHYRLPARASVASAAVNVIISMVLATRFGMIGIAGGTLAAAVLVNGIVVAAAVRLHGVRPSEYVGQSLLPSLTPAVGATLFGLLIREVMEPAHLGTTLLAFLPTAGLFWWLLWRRGLDATERQTLTSTLVSWNRMLRALHPRSIQPERVA